MTGVVFATEMEARPFLERGTPDGVVVVVSGIGCGAAGAATHRLIAEHGCETVVNAGVCGALGGRLGRGKAYRVRAVVHERRGAVGKLAIGRRGKRLVTVDEPVFDPERRERLSRLGDLVDMEGHAVARVCGEHGVRCILVKGVTDFGDGNGKADIRRHIHPVSEAVAETVCRIVEGSSGFRAGTPATLLRKLHSFTKIEHTVFSLPLLFAGAWLGAGGMPPWPKLLLIALVGLGARTFGMAANRMLDKEVDAKNPRTKDRELPAGRLGMAQARAVAATGLALYFLGCALLGDVVLAFSPLPLVPLALYSLLKRFTPLCHYGIGLCLALAPLGAFVAVTNSLAFSGEAWLLAFFTFCWMSGFDIIYALLDIDFDRAHGMHSVPAALGPAGAQGVAAATHLAALAALARLWAGSGGGGLSFAALAISAAAFGAAYWPSIPVPVRFFPVSAIAGMAGAAVVLLGGR